MRLKMGTLVLVLAGWPTVAVAYVDPGMVSILVQGLFAAGLGAVSMWIVRPWTYLRSAFRRTDRKDHSNSPAKPSKDSG